MKIKTITKAGLFLLGITMIVAFVQKPNQSTSGVTGWKYNDKNSTGFTVKPGYKLQTPIGMVAIEGGSFTIGEKGEFVTAPRDNKRRRITVSSFYMDQYEIRNVDWREYTNWMEVVFARTAPLLVEKTQPNKQIWREELAYNEPYLQNYFTHPAFDQYPVVGVTWEQAMDYCAWRTDRVNELALIRAGIIAPPDFSKLENMPYDSIRDNFVFNTQKYLLQSSYQPQAGKRPKTNLGGQVRKVDMSDGILFSDFRLPTEAEWEFAAYAIQAGADGMVPEGKIYPWSGAQMRNPTKKQLGQMQANFVRGRGDMMGTSGSLNDRATITAPVNAYYPNDFGLYNMAGNVNEWVLDVYRPTSFEVVAEYNSFRGNVYLTPRATGRDQLGRNIYQIDSLGRIANDSIDFRDFKDGDPQSQINFSLANSALLQRDTMDITDILRPVISKDTRIYKGGSWKDRVYWLNPSTRRYLDQGKAANDIGFRCAMSMIGNIEQKKR
ncbi:MAG: SUMF1/EgtB/PvdO family nonheme iron enzyme [Paludibacteraceae bacterium]|nr:SUMF1/EgtB/PvdO family nonheme iron enzyme [Paludibacteraceae bacterium]